MRAAMVGVFARALTPKSPRDAAAATPIGLVDVRLELAEPGVIGIVGSPRDGAGLFVDVFSGRARPDRGTVVVDGADPARRASIRARIALLGPAESEAGPAIPLGRTAALAAANALSIQRGAAPDERDARALLERWGLAALADRRTAELAQSEARAIELAIALETPRPALVLLADPFSSVGPIDAGKVREAIARSSREAPVIVTSASARELRTIASELAVLARGALVRGGEARRLLADPPGAEIHVWLASRAKDTLRALLETSGITSVTWERGAGPEEDDAGVLRVKHSSVEELGLAIADAVVKTEARVVSMSEVAPGDAWGAR